MFAQKKSAETQEPEKLSGPQFIPVPEVKPRPAWQPHKFGAAFSQDKQPDARRVVEADFVDLNRWLIPKLSECYPRATPEGISGYLRSMTNDRHHAFFRHNDAALLVYAEVTGLEPRPVVRQLFCKIRATKADSVDARKACYEQAFELSRLALDWAKSIKAVQFRYGESSDIPLNNLYDAVPNAVKKEYYVVSLGS